RRSALRAHDALVVGQVVVDGADGARPSGRGQGVVINAVTALGGRRFRPRRLEPFVDAARFRSPVVRRRNTPTPLLGLLAGFLMLLLREAVLIPPITPRCLLV
ncbi:unnamed protein product, partial [Ectocarpus sp. 13 AM-2016]